MKTKQFIALLLTLSMIMCLFTGCNVGHGKENESAIPTDNAYGLRENVKDGAILHCFSWSFETIEESLEDIAMAGYSAIQTSPINLCYDGGNAGPDLYGEGKWYYHYQPTDWKIGNYQLGIRDEFISLCKKADEYGIKVIVDVAPNHTTTTTEAIAQSFIDAVGGMDKMYHSDGMTTITDYTDREQCTLQAVGGLYDVDTENKAFQDYFIAFLNDCIACGADGFRYDTAKHIGLSDDPKDVDGEENNFWDRVTTEVENAEKLFVYGETLQDNGERIEDYIEKIGAATASAFGQGIRQIVTASYLTASQVDDVKVGKAEPNVVTWVESHDNYISDGTGKELTNEQVKIAYTLITAKAEGTPLFFARPYGATNTNIWGTFNKIGMAGDNLYKDETIVAVNRFRNAMVGLPEHIFNVNEDNRVLCIERGAKGAVLVNMNDDSVVLEMETSLENGEYTNRVDDKDVYTVKKGKLTGEIPANGIIILYNEGYIEKAAPASVKVADETTSFIMGESLEVKLEAKNTEKATYAIDGGEEVTFKDGDSVILGEGAEESDIIRLTLRGENKEGTKTCISYLFKKQGTVKAGTKIYFEKPEDWGDKINAYVYDETSKASVQENKRWPGEAMVKEADGRYSYTFTKEWIVPLVIFNDGVRQSNGELEPGDQVIADKVYTVE